MSTNTTGTAATSGAAAKRIDPTTLGGHAANATRETMPRLIWIDAVETAAIGAGVPAAMLSRREGGHREAVARMFRAYEAGEPVWMATDALRLAAEAAARATREDAADREAASLKRILRAAVCK